MNGHTPGPWELEYEDGDGAHVIRMGSAISSPGHHQVQHSLTYEHGLFPDEDRPRALAQFHEAEANARLIAAAPEMYELLVTLDPNGHNKRVVDLIHRIDGIWPKDCHSIRGDA